MFQHGFVPQELPVNFPQAIRQVLLTIHPSSRQRLIDVAVGSAMVSLASQELMFLAMVLRQRRDLLVEEASRREQVLRTHSGDSAIQAGSLFVLGMMQVSNRIADSDVANLTNVPMEDPKFPLPVSLEELDQIFLASYCNTSVCRCRLWTTLEYPIRSCLLVCVCLDVEVVRE